MRYKGLSAHVVERSCDISNGYLKKQFKGKGGMGSEILEKIYHHYPDLDLVWLITGKGKMLITSSGPDSPNIMQEPQKPLDHARLPVVVLLKRQVKMLEEMNADKEKIIRLLEKTIR